MIVQKKNPVLIDVPMPIETPRLLLRNPVPGDGKAMFEAKEESFDELQKWMPWAKELGTVENSELVARKSFSQFILREDLMMLAFEKETGKKVASTGLHRMDWDRGYFEIDYWVRSTETGKGYATEITNALIRYAFGALGAKKVSITHAGGNEGSRRVIEKLDFELMGIIKDGIVLPSGTMADHHWYARHDTEGLPELEVSWGHKLFATGTGEDESH